MVVVTVFISIVNQMEFQFQHQRQAAQPGPGGDHVLGVRVVVPRVVHQLPAGAAGALHHQLHLQLQDLLADWC